MLKSDFLTKISNIAFLPLYPRNKHFSQPAFTKSLSDVLWWENLFKLVLDVTQHLHGNLNNQCEMAPLKHNISKFYDIPRSHDIRKFSDIPRSKSLFIGPMESLPCKVLKTKCQVKCSLYCKFWSFSIFYFSNHYDGLRLY